MTFLKIMKNTSGFPIAKNFILTIFGPSGFYTIFTSQFYNFYFYLIKFIKIINNMCQSEIPIFLTTIHFHCRFSLCRHPNLFITICIFLIFEKLYFLK